MIGKILYYGLISFIIFWIAIGVWTAVKELLSIFVFSNRSGKDDDPSGNDNVKRQFYDYM